jgi:hypothetical protein
MLQPVLSMLSLIQFDFLEEYLGNINLFLEILFGYLKYIFGGLLIIIGLLTLFSLRGKFFLERLRYKNEEDLQHNPLTIPRLIIGIFYIIFATGIIFDWFTYLLIIVLDPLPDRFLFIFISFTGIVDPFGVNSVYDIRQTPIAFEKTIYYAISICSFIALLDIIISIWQMAVRDNINEKKTIIALIGGLAMAMMTGFTTCLPLFL